MRPLIAAFIFILLAAFSFACKKDTSAGESELHGAWVKGSNLGDTLWFLEKNGRHFMRIAESFNPLMPIYAEKEYRLQDGKLSIKIFTPVSGDYFPMNSFQWTDHRKEFTIQNSELFMFLSSIITYKYRKI